MTISIRILFVLISTMAWLLEGSVFADVTVSMTPSQLSPQPIEDGGYRAAVVLTLKGIKAETPEPDLKVSDLGVGQVQEVLVTNIQAEGGLTDERHWLLEVTFEQRPETRSDTRFLGVIYGSQVNAPLRYSVLPSRVQLDWSVTDPIDDWILHQNKLLGFSITANAVPISDLQISLSTLQRTDKQQHLNADDFRLCKDGACTSELTQLPANQTHTVYLKVADDFDATGQFEGELSLTARGASAAHPLPLTIYASSRGWQLFGGTLILIGIGLAWFVSVFAKGRSSRLTGLVPASVLRDKLAELEAQVTSAEDVTTATFPNIREAITLLNEALSDEAITRAGYVPRHYPNPFQTMAPKEKEYEAYLKKHTDQIRKLSLVIVNGVSYMTGHWGRIAGQEAQALLLLTKLDGAIATLDIAKVKAMLEDSVERFQQLLIDNRKRRSTQEVPEAMPQQSVSLTTQSIEVRLVAISGIVWLIWALITAGVGWMVLIHSNPGFGTVTDLMEAFFWGLGVQVAGQQLQQLTPASVSAAFQITLPSAKG